MNGQKNKAVNGVAKSSRLKRHLEACGEFRVASELFLRDCIATLAPKNYDGFDLIVYNPLNEKTVKVQVKTTVVSSFILGKFKSKEELLGKFKVPFVFVKVNEKTKELRFFIVPAVKVGELIWLSWEDWFARPHRKQIVPFEETPQAIPIKDLEEYENKWELLSLW